MLCAVAVRCVAEVQDSLAVLGPALQALAQVGPLQLLPQGAEPELGPGWVGAPAGPDTHVYLCLRVSGGARGIVGCWGTWRGPQGHCGMLGTPRVLWEVGEHDGRIPGSHWEFGKHWEDLRHPQGVMG